MAARQFDVVVYGATGFTGGLVAEYLSKSYPADKLRFAIAGRSEGSLKRVQQALVPLAGREVEMIIANASQPDSLAAMAKQTRVVLSTVGPFAKYGTNLVAACVENGTSYVDTTGESPWVRSMIDKYDTAAKAAGSLVVPMCGFDSIPSDIGSFHLVSEVRRQLNASTALVESCVKMKGAASGGTVHSAMNLLDSKENRRSMGDPLLLCAPTSNDVAPATVAARTRPAIGISYNRPLSTWCSPFIMAGVNEQVVRRSAYLSAQRGQRYAKGVFQYRERTANGNFFVALATMGFMVIGFILVNFRLVRWAIRRAIKPGQGPSRKSMANGFMRIRMVATTDEPTPRHAFLAINGNSDPGYSLTAQMVSEAALCIAFDKSKLPGAAGGIFTPATGMGNALVKRLHETGITFTVATTKDGLR